MGLLLIVPESEIDPGSVPDPDRSLLAADLDLAGDFLHHRHVVLFLCPLAGEVEIMEPMGAEDERIEVAYGDVGIAFVVGAWVVTGVLVVVAVSCVNLSPVEFRKLGEGIVGEELVLTVGFEALADLFAEV